MEGYKREFIQFLQGAGVLKFGDFTAKSGRKIPYFVNAGMIKTGDEIAKLVSFMPRHILRSLPRRMRFCMDLPIRVFPLLFLPL